jgi:hypothetical protein
MTPLAQSGLDARFAGGKSEVVEVMAACQDGVPVVSS